MSNSYECSTSEIDETNDTDEKNILKQIFTKISKDLFYILLKEKDFEEPNKQKKRLVSRDT